MIHRPAVQPERRRVLLALALVAAIYGLVFTRIPAHVFWSPDEGGKVLQLLHLRWQDGLAYDLPYPGRALDPALRFLPHLMALVDQGTIYSWWPIWFPLVNLPGYLLLGAYGLYLLPLTAGLLCGWLSYRLVRSASPTWAPLAIPLVGLCTPVFFYSLTFWEHTLATALALGALALLGAGRGRLRRFVAAGALLALALTLRPEMLLVPLAVLPVLLVQAWRSRRPARPVALLLGCLLGLLPLLGFNLTVEGHLLGRRYGGELTRFGQGVEGLMEGQLSGERPASSAPWLLGYLRAHGLELIPDLIVGSTERLGPNLPAVLTWGGALLYLVCLALPWWPRRWPPWPPMALYAALLALSTIVLAWPEPHQAFHGLIVAPQLVFAAWGLRVRPDRFRLLAPVTLLFPLLYLLAMALAGWEAAGGLQWGPRYLLLLFPLGSVLALQGVSQLERIDLHPELRRFVHWCLAFMLLLGLLFQARGLAGMGREKERIAAWVAEIETLPSGPLLTDLPWLPGVLPFEFDRHQWFLFYDPAGLQDWLEQAQSAGVGGACYAGFAPPAGWPAGGPQQSREVSGLWIACWGD